MGSCEKGKKIVKYVIWDWNGTLFNDVKVCITSMNRLLERNQLPLIEDDAEYRSKFSFPIKNYYKNLGFDFEKVPFEQLAKEFMDIYQSDSLQCRLTEEVENVISVLKKKGYRQIILSASKRKNLIQQMEQFGISSYFEEILGLSDIYAKSKVEIAREWIEDKTIKNITVIGDTYHDYDVAKELNALCLLYSKGHQSISKNEENQYKVVEDINHIIKYL